MKDERLSAVAILNIEHETANFIEANHMDDIIDAFAQVNENRKKIPFVSLNSASFCTNVNVMCDCVGIIPSI